MTATAEIGRIVREVLAAELSGWERRRHCFLRAIDSGVQTVSVQSIGAPSAVRAAFAVNLGVHFPELAEIRSLPFDPFEARDLAHTTIRLGSLCGRDSYVVGPTDAGVRALVQQDLRRHALPYLDRARTREGLLAVRGSSPLDCLALLLALGRVDEARACFRDHLAGRDDVVEYARERHALDLRSPAPAGRA